MTDATKMKKTVKAIFMKLLNFLTNRRKYEFLKGAILGFGGYLVFYKSQSIGFSKFQSIGFWILFCVLVATIKLHLIDCGSIQWLTDLLSRKSKKNTSKNPK